MNGRIPVVVALMLSQPACSTQTPSGAGHSTGGGVSVHKESSAVENISASDLSIFVDKVEPAFIKMLSNSDPEWYFATVRFECKGGPEIRFPFTAEMAQRDTIVGMQLDYQFRNGETWDGYWPLATRAYYPYLVDDEVRISKGQTMVAKFFLPFRERYGNPLTVRLRIGGAVSEPFVIDWTRDRNAGRFEASRNLDWHSTYWLE